MYTAEVKTEEKVATQLPEPKGYKILIGIPEVSEKTEGGLFMPDGLRHAEETASIVGFVIKWGQMLILIKNVFRMDLLPRTRFRYLSFLFWHEV